MYSFQCRVIWCRVTRVYSHSVSSFCIELSSCRVGGCRVGLHPGRTVSVHKNFSGTRLLSVLVGAVISYAFLSTPHFLRRQPYWTVWHTPSPHPHPSAVVSHTALNWHRLPISGQDFRPSVPSSCTVSTSGIRLKNKRTLNAHLVQPAESAIKLFSNF